MGLRGSHVVIIGGSSGIGRATAEAALDAGATVTIAARSVERLQRAKRDLGEVRALAADVTSEVEIHRLFDQLGSVDHVLVTAGRDAHGALVTADLQTLRLDVDQRFWGPVYVTRHAVPKMVRGSITFLSGQYGSRPIAGAAVTAAMNAAVETLTKGLAVEVAPIRVNAVAPGLVDTPYLGEFREAAADWAATALPVARMGSPREVAQAVLLLMTNDFITGEVLHIDGGGRYV